MNVSANIPERNLPPLPHKWTSLAHAFLHQVRMRPHALAVVDSLGRKLTYEKLLVAAIALTNELSGKLHDSSTVGIFLPPSAGAAIANVAVALLGKISANLNYTTSQSICDAAIKESGINYVITSGQFLKRISLNLNAENLIDLDKIVHDIGVLRQVRAWLEAELPDQILKHLLPGLDSSMSTAATPSVYGQIEFYQDHDGSRLSSPATLIFTSGSTGTAKGVVLSHSNILSNVHAISLQGHIREGEIVLGVIPYFHSFGLTMTLWAPLCLGETVVYHYNPLEARKIADLCEKFKATTLICTPTMLSSYLRRCSIEKFSSLKNCIIGGEKLRAQQRREFEELLGMLPLEGYGLAETSPVVACNVGCEVTLKDGRRVSGTRPGTVGLPLPGTTIRIRDQSTGKDLPPGQEGMIVVSGPQVMMGYFNRPEATASVLKDGWFTTGDIGFIDDDGFLTITGRLSQFSKIGGEMIAHLAVEEEIVKLNAAEPFEICVTSTTDLKRGEKLVVVYSHLYFTPRVIVEKMRASTVSRLWIPQPEDFIQIDEIPVLGNGKRDLNYIKKFVADHYVHETSVSI
jgi:acyl-[acyl-carrier-protein]-phospholipid O-acyltransferase/long-chain-fatty-acid--[acyl-carrier-protein] ligase